LSNLLTFIFNLFMKQTKIEFMKYANFIDRQLKTNSKTIYLNVLFDSFNFVNCIFKLGT